MLNNPELMCYPVIEVAAGMEVSLTRVRKLLDQGRLKKCEKAHNVVFITRASLVGFYDGERGFKERFLDVRKQQKLAAENYDTSGNHCPLLTTGEAASLVGIGLNRMQLLCEMGRVPYFRTEGGHRRIGLLDLQNWYRRVYKKELEPHVLSYE
jgi:excisionase family DNA binding protein